MLKIRHAIWAASFVVTIVVMAWGTKHHPNDQLTVMTVGLVALIASVTLFGLICVIMSNVVDGTKRYLAFRRLHKR